MAASSGRNHLGVVLSVERMMSRWIAVPFERRGRGRWTVWPRRVAERPVDGESRVLEPWEADTEEYPAEVVLRDLERFDGAESDTERVIVRFVALRALLVALGGQRTGEPLLHEMACAEAYLGLLASADAERRALSALLPLAGARPPEEVALHLVAAGEAADAAGHRHGAFGLWRAAFDLALARGWVGTAARAARSIEASARAAGGRRSARRWGMRARRLELRASDG
jgi:hypothetical protein